VTSPHQYVAQTATVSSRFTVVSYPFFVRVDFFSVDLSIETSWVGY